MGLLDSFGSTLQGFGGKLDNFARDAVKKAGFSKELSGVFQEVQAAATEKHGAVEALQLPEFYQKAVNVLLKNESAFADVNNIAEFMQGLVDTKAYAVLNAIDVDAPVVLTGSRQDDFAIVLAGVRVIAGITKDYTPQDVNFDKPYKFGLAGDTLTVMVRQSDGSYAPLIQNKQSIPDDTSFRNLVPTIGAHMKGLPGGYEEIHKNVPVVATAINAPQIAQALVNKPDGTSVVVPNQTNPNQSTLTA